MRYLLGLILLLGLLLTGCHWVRKKDPEPELPPATQEGRNRFGCRVNGKAWVPKTSFNLQLHPLEWEYLDSLGRNGYFHASAIKKTDGIYQGISIGGSGIHNTGTYTLIKDSIGARFIDVNTDCEYHTVAGELQITKLDKSQRIIAGTFHFTFAEPNCDTVRITDGRFDFRY